MRLITIDIEKKYKRIIEKIGNDLVFFKISTSDEFTGIKFHLFYNNGWKPPLDIAINTETHYVEYISFFAQDEKIEEMNQDISIIYSKKSMKIEDTIFSENCYERDLKKDFSIRKINNDIILELETIQQELYAYQLNEKNYILCNKNEDIVGILLKDINQEEYKVLRDSNIL